MRLLARNKRPVWYCLYKGVEMVKDSDGNRTGERAVAYQEPVRLMCNVTAASGSAAEEGFGIGVSYDKVIQVDGTTCPIDERTMLYVDSQPPGDFDPTDATCDYAVTRVSKSLNHTSIAISRVRQDG